MATVVTLDDSFRGAMILFALPREAWPFIRSFGFRPGRVGPGVSFCIEPGDADTPRPSDGCDPRILAGLLGVGLNRARTEMDRLLVLASRPRVVVVAGYAGALRPGLAVGDIVAAAEVIDPVGRAWPTDWPAARSGRVLTSEQLVGAPSRKLELGEQHSADAVDMESAAVAEVCASRGVPFGCVRVISDEAGTPLSPRLLKLLENDTPSAGRVCRELMRSPRLLLEMVRLARHTKRAGRNLATALRALLDQPDAAATAAAPRSR